MFKVWLGSDDFYKDSEYVKIGNVVNAIAKILRTNGSPDRFQAERDAWPHIYTGIVAGKLHPLDPETLNVLSKDHHGNGMVLFSELVVWGRAGGRFDFVKYVPLTIWLADYWDKPLSELPEALQARVNAAFGAVNWDSLSPGQRRRHVSQIDRSKTPEYINESLIAWHNYLMDASAWFDLPDVTPQAAAMVLSLLNPHKNPDPERHVGGDKESPHRYKLLLEAFESVARANPKHRTLLDWREIADQKKLRYHPWIDEYAEAIAARAVQEAPAAKGEAVKRGITKQQVINAFEGLHFNRDQWGKALGKNIPNWLKQCQAVPGKRGDSKNSATWNPVLIAVALTEKPANIPSKKLDPVFVGLKDWANEWTEASALFRD